MNMRVSTIRLRGLLGMLAVVGLLGMSRSSWAYACAEPPDDEPFIDDAPWMARDKEEDEPQRRRAGPRGQRPRLAPGIRGERRPGFARERFKLEQGPGFREGPRPSYREMVSLVMEVVRHNFPNYHQRLKRLKQRSPERFEKTVRRMMPVILEYVSLREQDPEAAETIIEEFKIEERLRELSDEYRLAQGHPGRQEEIESEVADLVREQFHLRLMRQEARLREFEERLRKQHEHLARERERVEREMAHVEERVARRTEEILLGKTRERFKEHEPGEAGREGFGPPPRRRLPHDDVLHPERRRSDRQPPQPIEPEG